MRHGVLVCALLSSACGAVRGDGEDAGVDALVCDPNAAPAAPVIVGPAAGRIDVVPAELVIESSPFADPDVGDVHGGSEFEIWSVRDGVADVRVWRASIDGASPWLTRLTLADGEQLAPNLAEWADYVVRARHRDDRGACSQWSPWSEDLRFRTDDGSTYLFDPSVIRDVYLTIPQASWDALNAQAYPPGCVPFERDYHTATLTFEGQTLPGVGIHIKGGCGSARDLSGKASFKVKLEWDDPAVAGCPAERRLFGQKHLTLNAGVQDRTLEHERLGYALYKDFGVPTPRAASVRLFVNGNYWGLYTHVETIGRRFLERWFQSKDGMLYEGTYWCDLLPENVPPGDDDDHCLTREFRPDVCDALPGPGADPLDYSPLRQLVQDIQALPDGGFYPEVEAFFDFDTFLSQWAIEAVISHWDAYEFSIMNNYRVYHDPVTDRWSIIPTGIDQTFLGDQDPWDVHGVLAARCRDEPDCEAAFAARLDLVNQHFVAVDLATRAQAIHDQITPDVLTDPRKEYDNAAFAQAFDELLAYIATRPGRVDEILASHGF